MKHCCTLIFAIVLLFSLTNCGINSNMMFKVPKGEYASADSIPLAPKEDYKISIDDKVTFTLSTNNGKKIVEGISGVGLGSGSGGSSQEYLVRKKGSAEFPVIGEVFIEGLTIAQCEDTLESYFSKQYQDPFVQVKVTNQRVIVFPGNGSDAKVISLANNNTTLMEVIAQAGGISERGRARSIKLMRRTGEERVLYSIDLSKIEGLKYADIIVQGNDYIYIEPKPELAQGVLKEAAPIISIFSSALLIFTIFRNL